MRDILVESRNLARFKKCEISATLPEQEAEGRHGHPRLDVHGVELGDAGDHQGLQDQARHGDQDGQEDDIG